MGTHCGYIAANLAWPNLLSLLTKEAGDFIDRGKVENPETYDWSWASEGYLLLAGELGPNSYLVDSHQLLSSNPDFIAWLASASGALVVGHGAETVSGSYWFTAAKGSNVLRQYSYCGELSLDPYTFGEPFPTEDAHPLNDGPALKGQWEVLGHLGFDYDRWFGSGLRRCLLFTEATLPKEGMLSVAASRFFEQFRMPERKAKERSAWKWFRWRKR